MTHKTPTLIALGMALIGAGFWLTNPGPAMLSGLCRDAVVIDGDTFAVTCGWARVRVRLADVDAHEAAACPDQARAATAALARMLMQDQPHLTPLYRDRWDRVVAHVTVDGRDVARTLTAQGHVRPWPHDPTGRALAPRPEGC